jgi:cbb3-type cytochrome oxidase maturation protein
MESLFLLIPLSVLIIIGVSWIFLRMVSQGQFDDLDTPAQSILLDDDRAGMSNTSTAADTAPAAEVAPIIAALSAASRACARERAEAVVDGRQDADRRQSSPAN